MRAVSSDFAPPLKLISPFFFWFTAAGVLLGGIGLMAQSDLVFKAGASFLFIGAVFLFMSMRKMLSYGK